MTEIAFQPIGRRVTVERGATLLDAAQDAGVALSAVCGGVGICGDCRVRVLRGQVSALNDTERDHLTDAELGEGMRLACQTVIEDASAIVVDVPRESLSAAQRSQVEGEEIPLPVEPSIALHDLAIAPPSVDDLRGDWERVTGITPSEWQPTAPVLAQLPTVARANGWRARMASNGQRVVAFLPPDAVPLGFAVDVGTTGLAAYLVNLQNGETLGIAGATNPQIAYGEDVMARLTLVVRDKDGARRLQTAIVDGLNELAAEVCRQASVQSSRIVDAVAVGNTAMHHILLGLPTEQLGSAPYVPAISAPVLTPARDLGLRTAPGALVYLPPNVAGFVGADHVAMLLATEMAQQPGITLALDIGTNTEISINANGEMWSCSTASGPAFEGAHIRDGMRAADGAIERVLWQDDGMRWLTINQAPPVGLCGSGILDAVAALRQSGIVTPTGAMKRDFAGVQGENHNVYYEIVPARRTGHGRAVIMSRSDVNEVQLAKAAIRAGIKLLAERVGLGETDIDRVIVAGAFGNYIDIENAIAIGMFPPLPVERFHQVGNAAGIGAKRLLINARERQRAVGLVARLRYIELTNHPDFTDRFSQAVRLVPDPWE